MSIELTAIGGCCLPKMEVEKIAAIIYMVIRERNKGVNNMYI